MYAFLIGLIFVLWVCYEVDRGRKKQGLSGIPLFGYLFDSVSINVREEFGKSTSSLKLNKKKKKNKSRSRRHKKHHHKHKKSKRDSSSATEPPVGTRMPHNGSNGGDSKGAGTASVISDM